MKPRKEGRVYCDMCKNSGRSGMCAIENEFSLCDEVYNRLDLNKNGSCEKFVRGEGSLPYPNETCWIENRRKKYD